LWVHARSALCAQHWKRWTGRGRPDVDTFIDEIVERNESTGERIDLRRLPGGLRLELAYVLQRRRDEAAARLIPWQVQHIVNALAASGLTSLLQVSEDDWAVARPAPQVKKRLGALAFLRDAYRRVEALAIGQGWDVEYPRGVWRLRNLGVHNQQTATLDFTSIQQSWLRELAKRWAHRQLSTGLSAATAYNSLRAVTWLSGWLSRPQVAVARLSGVNRALLERLLGDLSVELKASRQTATVAGLAGFFRAVHQYGWDPSLPAGAQLYPEDYPKQPQRLPRGLPDNVMAQVESPDNLDRWTDPALRLITVILIRCGLRISSAVGLPFDCVVTDADGAPYLRYWNTKMKREALVPIDDELHQGILEQQRRVLAAFPAATPVLFPRARANLDGAKPMLTQTYRDALEKWLAACEVRDEHGRPIHLTPHQWRHTLGTTLINRDVPQQVVQKILDHDSPEMTAHYARLSDATVRRHWEAALKVNHRGETVTLDPDGPLAEAAWAKHRLAQATQALPNGYCGLPLVKTCQHANACLTCPLFITTAQFLPQHREQHRQTLQIISTAQARGQTRMVEMNQQVADNLEGIITALEADHPSDSPGVAPDAC
jgi:integrase